VLGLAQPEGFVAHLCIPNAVQTTLADEITWLELNTTNSIATANEEAVTKAAQMLQQASFAIWIGANINCDTCINVVS
jgi:acetolactate synthase-1/2/3 large subunit